MVASSDVVYKDIYGGIMKYLLLLLISLTASIGCENESEQRAVDEGRDYYPVAEGRQWVYAYDSITYQRQLNRVDTVNGYLRETITDVRLEAQGDAIYRLERHLADTPVGPWRIDAVWNIIVSGRQLIRVEENLPIIKMVFPVLEAVRWDGLDRIDRTVEISVAGDPMEVYNLWSDFEYLSKGSAETVNGQTYDDVVTVLETDAREDSILDYKYSVTQYARGVGMITHQQDILECSNCNPDLDWDIKGDRGYRLSLNLISYR